MPSRNVHNADYLNPTKSQEPPMAQQTAIRPPTDSEYAEFYGLYIGRVPDGDIVEFLELQLEQFQAVLGSIDEQSASVIHDPYTWTIKQVVGHLIDAERVFGYRALRFASGDDRAIPGMEQNAWVENSDYVTPTLSALVDELAYSRRANLCFFKRLRADAWDRKGTADGKEMTVRAIAYCLVGHITHHLEIIKSRIGGR
jgi:hypothetical protein